MPFTNFLTNKSVHKVDLIEVLQNTFSSERIKTEKGFKRARSPDARLSGRVCVVDTFVVGSAVAAPSPRPVIEPLPLAFATLVLACQALATT